MKRYYVDGHIHIGRTNTNRAVKITASDQLTLHHILSFAKEAKGLDMIGIIDCHSPDVLNELKHLVRQGEINELPGGGLSTGDLTILLGSEIELYDANCSGPIHVLCYFPTLEMMSSFANWYQSYVSNPHLSSQRMYCDANTLQREVKERSGLFIPAHIFTPFKSLYGKGVQHHLTEVLNSELIDGVELGLSCDTSMAETIPELEGYTFLTNSDAHSLEMIGREYQALTLYEPSFQAFKDALYKQNSCRVEANFGLNPQLGKYYTSVCRECWQEVQQLDVCEHCGSNKTVKGVPTRIQEVAKAQGVGKRWVRPPYINQIPLHYVPGIGSALLKRLREQLHHDMYVIHEASLDELQSIVKPSIASRIMQLRKGELTVSPGGGGQYGHIE
ncbi:uncharacterized protein (TIGR00375 family) [Alkalibacillus flavidus]|uniref:Uncharacterized protein (TIGR00375 family) n=1 Tax=Alkalibacillus flavidus TaxID=546021 RepID=A0ABV2KUL3_9BACI